eukprot:5064165-Pleurochrysis_carterae.AAC.2
MYRLVNRQALLTPDRCFEGEVGSFEAAIDARLGPIHPPHEPVSRENKSAKLEALGEVCSTRSTWDQHGKLDEVLTVFGFLSRGR